MSRCEVAVLDVIGLREVDVAVYAAFAGRKSMTLAQLRAETGLSTQRLTPVLRGLTEKGLLVRFPGAPAAYAAVNPGVALDAIFRRKEQELEHARMVASRLQERHREAPGKNPVDLIEVVQGNEVIAERVEQLLRSAHREVVFVDKPPYTRLPTVLHPAEQELLNRGIRFRGVYDKGALELHDLVADLEAGLALGEQARVVSHAPLKLIVVDAHVGLVPLRSGSPQVGTALVVHPCSLLDALSALFGFLWDTAIPLRLPGGGEQGGEAPAFEDTRLLALLTTGMPDRSIAKQLGLSYRTFQRRLQNLMSTLGAATRFQAGLQAAARGWVTLPGFPGPARPDAQRAREDTAANGAVRP
ncbi:helix-turn-helix domain-containing protein [Amycolatopsis sp. NPDC059019]|uniref:helix-turn-helix domain-containing protein n=1 Tax=Amycolatopsis sp. NPDC059019 TaxID=3346702 RepID=UPI00366CD4C0